MTDQTTTISGGAALSSVEVGLVTRSPSLADFYGEVFGLERLDPVHAGSGTVHRLQIPGGVLKVMVPTDPPAEPGGAGDFLARSGFRYLTMRVGDLAAAVKAAEACGGRIRHGPMDLPGGSRVVIMEDPDGNTLEVAGPA